MVGIGKASQSASDPELMQDDERPQKEDLVEVVEAAYQNGHVSEIRRAVVMIARRIEESEKSRKQAAAKLEKFVQENAPPEFAEALQDMFRELEKI